MLNALMRNSDSLIFVEDSTGLLHSVDNSNSSIITSENSLT